MDNKWISEMISDVSTSTKSHNNQGARDKETTKREALEKYFPKGMRKEEYTPLLGQLIEEGFTVVEYRRTGITKWPTGKKHSYPNEEESIRAHLNMEAGTYRIVAQREWRSRLVVGEFFSVIITLSEKSDEILETDSHRSATFL